MKDTDREKLISLVKLLATPLDVSNLVASGAISKSSRGWYALEKAHLLPEHAWQQVSEIKSTTSSDSPARTLVKFKSSNAAAAMLYQQITGSKLVS